MLNFIARQIRKTIHSLVDYPLFVIADAYHYAHWSSTKGQPKNLGNARALMMYHTHSLEKGLSRSDFRPLFGARALSGLAGATRWWLEHGGSVNDCFLVQSCAVLHRYINIHNELGIDATGCLDGFEPQILQLVSSKGDCDPATDLLVGSHTPCNDYKSVIMKRRSIRNFGIEPVATETIKDVVGLSLRTPSVCNRQSARVHVFTNEDKIEEALRLQGGFSGYRNPQLLLLVTSDLTTFVDRAERREPYIDGGLFTMSILNNLEYYGLASCPLNTMFGYRQEKRIRRLLHIPDNECLIAFIAVGSMPANTLVPHSKRDSVDNVVKFHNL